MFSAVLLGLVPHLGRVFTVSLKEKWLSFQNKNVWEGKRHFIGLVESCGGSGRTL